jgi:hypothetical protein
MGVMHHHTVLTGRGKRCQGRCGWVLKLELILGCSTTTNLIFSFRLKQESLSSRYAVPVTGNFPLHESFQFSVDLRTGGR